MIQGPCTATVKRIQIIAGGTKRNIKAPCGRKALKYRISGTLTIEMFLCKAHLKDVSNSLAKVTEL